MGLGKSDGAGPEVVLRVAARVVLVDTADRVLLIEGHDPSRPQDGWWWFTPGGGLEPGESLLACAVREVHEETGLRLDAESLGPVLRQENVEFGFEGRLVRQRQVFYRVVVAPFEAETSGWHELERRCQRRVRWWTLQELAATAETVYPAGLATWVSSTTRSGWA